MQKVRCLNHDSYRPTGLSVISWTETFGQLHLYDHINYSWIFTTCLIYTVQKFMYMYHMKWNILKRNRILDTFCMVEEYTAEIINMRELCLSYHYVFKSTASCDVSYRFHEIAKKYCQHFKNLLLQNHLANFYQTWHKACLGDWN